MNTRKTIITSALAVGALAGSAGIASAVNGSGSSPSSSAPSQSQSQTDTETETETDDPAVVAPDGAITSEAAGQAALDANPGSTLIKVQLEDENGVVMYEVELTDGSGAGVEVGVDATDGSILAQEADDGEHEADDANEGPEGNDASEGPESNEAPEVAPAG